MKSFLFALFAGAGYALYVQWRRILMFFALYFTYDASRVLAAPWIRLSELSVLHVMGVAILFTLLLPAKKG